MKKYKPILLTLASYASMYIFILISANNHTNDDLILFASGGFLIMSLILTLMAAILSIKRLKNKLTFKAGILGLIMSLAIPIFILNVLIVSSPTF
ncbi:hypothetical protein [Leeuwenhoekiella sp. H156]|uniref:hypothetical protein n=1 Tax=Leeuwenhoekiella sp. H156 TaxID=3450128 RepID=UPI003FA491A0